MKMYLMSMLRVQTYGIMPVDYLSVRVCGGQI